MFPSIAFQFQLLLMNWNFWIGFPVLSYNCWNEFQWWLKWFCTSNIWFNGFPMVFVFRVHPSLYLLDNTEIIAVKYFKRTGYIIRVISVSNQFCFRFDQRWSQRKHFSSSLSMTFFFIKLINKKQNFLYNKRYFIIRFLFFK